MGSASSAPWKLSGFGDEIDQDPAVQAAVLSSLGASHIEVRSAWETNIVDLSADQLVELQAILARNGLAVSAIASPVGKVDISEPPEHELDRLGRAIAAAHALDARYIRIFSFYRGAGVEAASIRDEVLRRMSVWASLAENEGVVLLHENEKDIYGDIPSRVLQILEGVGSDSLRFAWDSANFVQVGVKPFTDGYAMLRPHLEYLQVKDAIAATGAVVPAGEGDGELVETLAALRDDGWSGFASLEPHLAESNALGGFSGPDGFGRAARAFARLTDNLGIAVE